MKNETFQDWLNRNKTKLEEIHNQCEKIQPGYEPRITEIIFYEFFQHAEINKKYAFPLENPKATIIRYLLYIILNSKKFRRDELKKFNLSINTLPYETLKYLFAGLYTIKNNAINEFIDELKKLEHKYTITKEQLDLKNIPESEQQYNFLFEKYLQCCDKHKRSFTFAELGEFTKDIKGILPNKKEWNKPRFLNKNNWNEICKDFLFTEKFYIRLMEMKNRGDFKNKPYMDNIISDWQDKYKKLNKDKNGILPRPETTQRQNDEYNSDNVERDNTEDMDKFIHSDFDDYIRIPKKEWNEYIAFLRASQTFSNNFVEKFTLDEGKEHVFKKNYDRN
jgi:hypothetical protein